MSTLAIGLVVHGHDYGGGYVFGKITYFQFPLLANDLAIRYYWES